MDDTRFNPRATRLVLFSKDWRAKEISQMTFLPTPILHKSSSRVDRHGGALRPWNDIQLSAQAASLTLSCISKKKVLADTLGP